MHVMRCLLRIHAVSLTFVVIPVAHNELHELHYNARAGHTLHKILLF